MITVRLKGGFGNQMFQYAAGLALARRRGVPLALDLTFLLDRTPRSNFIFRDYDLPALRVEVALTPLSRAMRRAPVPAIYPLLSIVGHGVRRATGREGRWLEAAGGEAPARDRLYLDGYWQSERWFTGMEAELRERFQPRLPLSAEAADLAAELAQPNSVCVNFRRADFVALPRSASEHGFVEPEYHLRAVADLAGQAPDLRIFVFSDEIEWCRENVRFPGFTTKFVDHTYKGERFAQYLRLMSLCRHFVIPNSSFAWWAAWLGEQSDSLVYAPRRWSADGRPAPPDLLPPRWRQV